MFFCSRSLFFHRFNFINEKHMKQSCRNDVEREKLAPDGCDYAHKIDISLSLNSDLYFIWNMNPLNGR